MPHNHSVLGQLFVETFWRCAFNVKVKGLNWNEEAAEWQEGKEGTHFCNGLRVLPVERLQIVVQEIWGFCNRPRSRYCIWKSRRGIGILFLGHVRIGSLASRLADRIVCSTTSSFNHEFHDAFELDSSR
jgi:hypothetical protein